MVAPYGGEEEEGNRWGTLPAGEAEHELDVYCNAAGDTLLQTETGAKHLHVSNMVEGSHNAAASRARDVALEDSRGNQNTNQFCFFLLLKRKHVILRISPESACFGFCRYATVKEEVWTRPAVLSEEVRIYLLIKSRLALVLSRL